MTAAPSDNFQLVNAAIAARLTALCAASALPQVVFLPVACGLGGQISGRVHTLLLAVALGRQPVFLRAEDLPYGQTFTAGAPVLQIPQPYDQIPAARTGVIQPDRVVCYDPRRMDPADETAEPRLLALISQQLGVAVPSSIAAEGAVMRWLTATPDMATFCAAERERLGVSPTALGVHFRRGDKKVETAYVPAAEFNHRIAEMHRVWPFSELFLASDSPSAADEIVCPAGVRLIFDTAEQRYNNANHKMLISSPGLARQETRSAYKNIFLLAQCGGIIGQHNAHFATLAAASIYARDGRTERCDLIDGQMSEQRAPILALYFRAKKGARALGRMLLPWLTTSARMKRLS